MDDAEKTNGDISNVSLTVYVGEGAWEHSGSLNHQDLCNLSSGSAGCSLPHCLSAARQLERSVVESTHGAACCDCRQLPGVQAVAGCPQHSGEQGKQLGGSKTFMTFMGSCSSAQLLKSLARVWLI